jgi:hypothetical protein
MPVLGLNTLHCKGTEDWTGADEVYLPARGGSPPRARGRAG